MKRVFRSCLDPLPRFLSTRSLAFVVLLVVGGTGFSVYEYVQSGRHTARTWPRSVRASERAPSPETMRACGAYASALPCGESDVPGPAATRSTGPTEAGPSPATLFGPEPSGSGS